MRAVLDVNVLISGLLFPGGAPTELIRRWNQSEFELVVSPALLEELERALGYPKLSKRILPGEVDAVVESLRGSATLTPDPAGAPRERSVDPYDDYLIALASETTAVLVSGDKHLLALADRIPVRTPREFLQMLPG